MACFASLLGRAHLVATARGHPGPPEASQCYRWRTPYRLHTMTLPGTTPGEQSAVIPEPRTYLDRHCNVQVHEPNLRLLFAICRLDALDKRPKEHFRSTGPCSGAVVLHSYCMQMRQRMGEDQPDTCLCPRIRVVPADTSAVLFV